MVRSLVLFVVCCGWGSVEENVDEDAFARPRVLSYLE